MKKLALSIVLVLLVSCQNAPVINSTSTPLPTNTIIPATVTSTVAPTSTPVPPTATTIPYNSTVNIFPLKTTEGTFDFECIADFDNIISKHYTTPDGTTVKNWVNCDDGGTQFLLPLMLDNSTMFYPTLSNGVTSKNPPSEIDDAFVHNMTQRMLEILKLKGKAEIIVVGGSNSGMILRHDDPYPAIFEKTGWDKAMIEFAQTGNPSVLPEISGFSGKLFFGYRIEPAKK